MNLRAHIIHWRFVLTLGVALLASFPSTSTAQNWLHFRGPEQNGIVRQTNLINDWSLEGDNVLWTSPIGGLATPIVLNNRVYLNCLLSEDSTGSRDPIHTREQVVCRDLQTGKLIWRDAFNVFQTDIAAQRVGWASMAGDAETGYVYMHSVSGLFRCYNSDGQLQWEHSLVEEYGKISGYGGRTQSPIIDENRVILGFLALNWGDTGRPPPKQYYYAFDKRNGKLLWMSAPGGIPHDTNYSVPIVKVIDGVRMLIGGNSDGGCYAINARTGDPIWGYQMSKRAINASPVTDGQHVFISHGEDNLDNLEFGSVVCIDATGSGDVTKSHQVWRVDGIKAGYASLLVHDGILYVVSDIGLLYGLDSKSGEKLWQHNLGTMGRGSPVWADGKLYVTEVDGNFFILKADRNGCKTLSHVKIPSASGEGSDSIFSSPAIVGRRILLVTSEQTICLGDKKEHQEHEPSPNSQSPNSQSPNSKSPNSKSPNNSIPNPSVERLAESTVARVHLVPAEAILKAGEETRFELHSFDKNGRLIGTSKPQLQYADASRNSVVIESEVITSDSTAAWSGVIRAKLGEVTAAARVRYFPPLPWKWDFETEGRQNVPSTWISGYKFAGTEIGAGHAILSRAGKGRPSGYIWMGPAEMSGYTIQADVMTREQRRQMSNIGLTAQRYNLILKGNTGELEIQSWAPQLRMAQKRSFQWDPDVWYTLKLRVDIEDGVALVKGKAWPREASEPAEWTLEAEDPHPNIQGSPGLYLYRLSDIYFDNIHVFNKD
jgi:outer membrane protein assembly factor BamB